MGAVPHPCVDIHTRPTPQPSIPPWFAEIVLIASYLRGHGLLEAFGAQVRLVRARFGRYEVLDFLALLFGYVSGPCKPSLTAFTHLPIHSWRSSSERRFRIGRRAAGFWPTSMAPAWTPFGRCLRPLRICGGGLRRRLAASGIGLDSGI